ncbi:tyrosine--tRNA ligase [Halomicroarcula sp. GCM10025324]|uniref:tyrosine--tRNA ligase n=1 Tax=Haloarcula TaxID=2237 RepID=UPI0023E7D47A|nr:tyrosine--tRNA ligase [Halomicroarcula sp. ZS-22-S1]
MDTAERLDLVTRHTQEVVTEDELTELLDDDPSAYIGYAPTGEMHIGHFTTMRKLADFLQAGVDVTVLIADLHAHLDDNKSPFDLLDARSEYYEVAIEAMIAAAGADPDDVEFVRGTEFQLDEEYTLEMYRMAAETTISRSQRAASEVVRESESPKLGGLLYPLMQTLDVKALDADIAYGGVDQRGIYMLSREILPDHGGQSPVCLFAPLLSGLSGGKMSASEAASKVNLTDSPEAVEEKIGQAYCPAGELEDNGVLEYLDHLVFPVLDERGEDFVVERPEEYGGDLVYEDYDAVEADFLSGELHPADLKPSAAAAISDVIDPVRERLADETDLLAEAYPETYGE